MLIIQDMSFFIEEELLEKIGEESLKLFDLIYPN